MFTGIISAIGTVVKAHKRANLLYLTIHTPAGFTNQLTPGASIAVDGVCLTTVDYNDKQVTFEVISETLSCTSLGAAQINDKVHLERSARFGDEIGGHLVSGHVHTTATITHIEQSQNNYILTLQVPSPWIQYMIPKGYIALSGASLTIVDVQQSQNTFTVHLIPETLRQTLFINKKMGDRINVEVDTQTKVMVDTINYRMACHQI